MNADDLTTPDTLADLTARDVALPCGCPGNVVCSTLGNGGEQCSSCGTTWDREDNIITLREGPLNKAEYARLTLDRVSYNYEQARKQLEGLQTHVRNLAREREAAAEAVAKLAVYEG
jgi:hypothetical protein